MFKNFLLLTLKGIRYRPKRSWLTILGIVIGIMLVVIILSLGSGIQNSIAKAMQMFGSDLIVIMPGKETNPFMAFLGGQKFRESDLMPLEEIEGVEFILPRDFGMLNIEYKGEKKSILGHAAPWHGMANILEKMQGIDLESGKWPTDDKAREVVLGYMTAKNLFKTPIKLNDEIIVKSKRMKVVGTISEIGNQMDDNILYLSLDVFRDLTGSRGGAVSALAKTAPDANKDLIAKQIKFQLSKQDVVREFSVLTPEKAGRLVSDVLTIVELALVMIALISLLVGAVGIMNTMYTSVLERTKQIGVMKALGASSESILSLFLIESGMIGLVGGVFGILLGLGIAFVIGLAAGELGVKGLFLFASLDFLGLLVILLITFITGVVAGVLPARTAARMEPAEALRYE